MTWPALPVFVAVAGQAVVLVGKGEAAEAKRRLLERAGAVVVGEDGLPLSRPDLGEPRLAIVVDDEPAAARLKARGLLVNVVDRPELCDFTLPAIVDRAPVLVAIGTGGVSAGLAAALRQRLEALLPAKLGTLAEALHRARDVLRRRYPDAGQRRRAIGAAFSGVLDPLADGSAERVAAWVQGGSSTGQGRSVRIALRSPDPDDLTLREARWLAQAERVHHTADVPPAILDRARADAPRIVSEVSPVDPDRGLVVFVERTWAVSAIA